MQFVLKPGTDKSFAGVIAEGRQEWQPGLETQNDDTLQVPSQA